MLSDKRTLRKTSLLWMLRPALDTRASLEAQLVKNPPTMREIPIRFLGQKFPWKRDMLPTLGFLVVAQMVKESECNAGDPGSIPGLGSSPGGGQGNPLQYSCLENPHGQRSLAGYSPWGPKESDMTAQHTAAITLGLLWKLLSKVVN